MEFVAWSNHKYVMHGFLWRWHKDHHVNDRKKVAMEDMEFSGFEKNDLFFIVYALPAIILIITGLLFSISELLFIGIGITLYGFTYFLIHDVLIHDVLIHDVLIHDVLIHDVLIHDVLIHDVLIHQRLNIPFLRPRKNGYAGAIIRAHLAHHRPKSESHFSNFGLLLFPKRHFIDEL